MGEPTTCMGMEMVMGLPPILTPWRLVNEEAVTTGWALIEVVFTLPKFTAWALVKVCIFFKPVFELTTRTCWLPKI